MRTVEEISRIYFAHIQNTAAIPERAMEIRDENERININPRFRSTKNLNRLIANLDDELEILRFGDEVYELLIHLLAPSIPLGEHTNINRVYFLEKVNGIYNQHLVNFRNRATERLTRQVRSGENLEFVIDEEHLARLVQDLTDKIEVRKNRFIDLVDNINECTDAA